MIKSPLLKKYCGGPMKTSQGPKEQILKTLVVGRVIEKLEQKNHLVELEKL